MSDNTQKEREAKAIQLIKKIIIKECKYGSSNWVELAAMKIYAQSQPEQTKQELYFEQENTVDQMRQFADDANVVKYESILELIKIAADRGEYKTKYVLNGDDTYDIITWLERIGFDVEYYNGMLCEHLMIEWK